MKDSGETKNEKAPGRWQKHKGWALGLKDRGPVKPSRRPERPIETKDTNDNEQLKASVHLPLKGQAENRNVPFVYVDLMQMLHRFFRDSLYGKGKDPGGVQGYLPDRCLYDNDAIKSMELGFLPSSEALDRHLKNGFGEASLDVPIFPCITIPLRTNGADGPIMGFRFLYSEDLQDGKESKQKYLYRPGLAVPDGFVNIRDVMDNPHLDDEGFDGLPLDNLIIVEDEFDALHCHAQGMANVVGIGSDKINAGQVEDALKRGYNSFTFVAHSDSAKLEAIRVLLNAQASSVYVCELPAIDGMKAGPDSFILKEGIDAFKKEVAGAVAYYEFWANGIIRKYGALEDESKKLNRIQLCLFTEDIVERGTYIRSEMHHKRFIFLFEEALKRYGIEQEELIETYEKAHGARIKKQQKNEWYRCLDEAQKMPLDQSIKRVKEGIESIESITFQLK